MEGSTAANWAILAALPVPSFEPLSIPGAERAAQIGGKACPRIRRTPRFVLRLVGLALPAVRELIEMEYAFDRDFIMRQDDWNGNFDLRATTVNAALAETIDAWRRDVGPAGRFRTTESSLPKRLFTSKQRQGNA